MSSKRIIRIWGLLLTHMLVASIIVPAAPVAAFYGQMQFLSQPLPPNNNMSDVMGIAVGPGVIYVIVGQNSGANIYRSTDRGASFTKTISPYSTMQSLTAISVSPDDANAIAVTDGHTVYTSVDGGNTWAVLPNLPASVSLNGVIKDLTVAPAHSGTLLAREYIIAVADGTAGQANGDLLIVGGLANWKSVLPTAYAAGGGNSYDWMAVKVTPNFVGDRSVVAVGFTSNTSNTTGGAVLSVINTSFLGGTGAFAISSNVTRLVTSINPVTIDFLATASSTSVLKASISLPSDFDATTSSGRRAYVGFASYSNQIDNDVYRVDDTASRALGAVVAKGIQSVSYVGTVASGTLFEGRIDTPEVKYSTDMTRVSPVWTTTVRLLPTTTSNTTVMAAPDFASSKQVYVATSGTGSAFSISNDGGISFYQTGIGGVYQISSGPSVTPDGKTLFMATLADGNINLWKSSTPTSDTSWQQVFVAPAGPASAASVFISYITNGQGGQVVLMPDYATTSTLMIFDIALGGNVYRSTDGGVTWNNQQGPSSTFVYSASAWQDSNVGYITSIQGNIYKTSNGGWTWTGPVTPNVGFIKSLTIGRTDELIVGGTGKIAFSKDGGTTFINYDANAGEFYQVAKDEGYNNNSVIYLADAAYPTGTGSTSTVRSGHTYRMALGIDAIPTDLLAPNPAGSNAITIRSGVLYNFYATQVDRTTDPLDTPGTITWRTLNAGGPNPGPLVSQGSGTTAEDIDTIVYLRRTTASSQEIWAYDDMMATAIPTITSPADNTALSIDPVTGRAEPFTLVLNAMGVGNGLATGFDVQVTTVDAGWAAATITSNIRVTSPMAPKISSASFVPSLGLLTGKLYQFRVRATNQVSGDNIDSPWSNALTLQTSTGGRATQRQFGLVLLAPAGGATDVSATPGFIWAPQYNATQYRFVLATDATLTKTVAGTPVTTSLPSFQVTTPLQANTTYFWSVQVVTPNEGPVSVSTFTTAAPPAPPAPALTITIPAIIIQTPTITTPPAQPMPSTTTPAFIWAIIIIGGILVITVLVLIIRTR